MMVAYLRVLLVLAALALGAGAAVVFLGLFDVSARHGHLPGVSWVLHKTFENSVRLRAPPRGAVPPLDEPDLVALGARHFAQACEVCHGAPQGTRTATAKSMLPAPPPIEQAVAEWQPRHLFWIVTNGVKMSGMPAWPADERDDDVWAVVAFLAAVPRMSEAEYRVLVAPPRSVETVPTNCAACHGEEGAGRGNKEVPRLDILGERYIAASLAAYRDGRRPSGVMQHAVSELDDAAIAAIARHYGGVRPRPQASPTDPDLAALGRALATGEAGSAEVPACAACHGPWPSERSPLFPELAGQHEPYLLAQLRLWHEGSRGGTPRANLMHQAATELGDTQMRALAAFYAGLSAK